MTHDDKTNAAKIAGLCDMMEEPLSFHHKAILPHVLTLALAADRKQDASIARAKDESACFWPDENDPLGQVHARVKLEKAQGRCNALAYLVEEGRGLNGSAWAAGRVVSFLQRLPEQYRTDWNDTVADAGMFISRLMCSQGKVRP